MAPFSCSEINKVKQSISWFYIYLLGKSDIFNHFTCVGPFPCGTLYQIVWTWYCKYIYKLSKIYTCLGLWVTTNGLVGHPFRCFWEIYEQQICLTMAYLIWLCGQIVNDFFFRWEIWTVTHTFAPCDYICSYFVMYINLMDSYYIPHWLLGCIKEESYNLVQTFPFVYQNSV